MPRSVNPVSYTHLDVYKRQVQDYDVVLKQYPTFLPGFVSRSEAKRKLGDNVGADRDYWAAIKMEEQAKNGQLPKTSSSGSNTAVNGDAKTDDSEENTREQSDKNINKFNRLVVYDKEQERKSKYQSEVRGRVQDRNVHVDLEPQFVLTYYEKADPVKKLVYYDKMVEDYNGQMVLKSKLRITNEAVSYTHLDVYKRQFLYRARVLPGCKEEYGDGGDGIDPIADGPPGAFAIRL